MRIKEELIKIFCSIADADPADTAILETPYLDKGLIDSFQVIEFITRIEETFKIKLAPEDIESEKFRTLGSMTDIIKKHRPDLE